MYVRPFGYVPARSVEEATTLLREHGSDAKLIAGGQSLVPLLNLGLAQVDLLVDGSTIPGLDTLSRDNGSLRIGATVRHRVIESSDLVRSSQPLLAAAASHVGNPRVRNRGTLGGSLAHADPAAELPLAMTVLEAAYEVSNGSNRRYIAAVEFATSLYTTSLAEDEILLSASVPTLGKDFGWGFREFSRRAGDFALVAAAALARCREGRMESVRLGVAGVADRPIRCRTFETSAPGTPVEDLNTLAEAIAADIGFLEDSIVSGEYRSRLAVVLSMRALADACHRAEDSQQ